MFQFDPKIYSGYIDRRARPFEYLDEVGIDKICELIEYGNGVLRVAELLGISSSVLRAWVNKDPARVQKVLLAKQFSGDTFAYKAEEVLMELKDANAHRSDVMVASKLSDHYRWMAERLDREQYGDLRPLPSVNTPLVLNINYGGANSNEPMKLLRLSSDEG
jgi:hypothetical protein